MPTPNLASRSTRRRSDVGRAPRFSITQAATTQEIRFVPFDETARQSLIAGYPFFAAASVPAGTYRGQEAEFLGLNVGSMHLIAFESADE